MRQTEYPHNTQEQVTRYLETALVVVDELDPPEDLRQLTFAKAVDLLAAKQIFYEQAALGVPNMAIPRG